MKKHFYSLLLLMGIVVTSFGQDLSKNAIGLRLGDNDGFGGEISYQRALSKENRLELDLGFRTSNDVDAFKLTGIYQWVWDIDNNFNWYAGAGAAIGSWSYDKRINSGQGSVTISDSGIIMALVGNIGIEYNFDDVPLQLSLDFRPEIYFNSDDYRTDNFGPDIALGIRYKFN
jgi:opacity protein-like surface antigen